MTNEVFPRRCRGVRRGERLTNRLGACDNSNRRYTAFTLLELIVVVGVIIIFTGLVLSTVGYA
jgi:type II secretory pathway pseudopilin PulG